MASINILLIEDDPLFAVEVEMLVRNMKGVALEVIDNSDRALKRIAEKLPDIFLIDILMEGSLNGIELAEKIRKTHASVPIIFITANMDERQYVQAREVDPAAYLVKPFNILTLRSAIETALHAFDEHKVAGEGSDAVKKQELEDEFFYIKQSRKVHKVSVYEISWLHSEGNYCMIYTKDKRFVVKTSMVRLKKRLPDDLYIQIHRGYIVRLDDIENIDLARKIIVVGDNELPIGKKYRSDLIDKIKPI